MMRINRHIPFLHQIGERPDMIEMSVREHDCRGPRAGFGRLAGEYGVRQYDAVTEWARWALDQLPEPQPDA